MRSADTNFAVGPRLTVTFALLVTLILGGNGLLIWQFHTAREQADRLSDVSQQMISVLRLQTSVASFHQRLGELAQLKNAPVLVAESRHAQDLLFEQIQRTRLALTHASPGAHVDPLLLPALDAIQLSVSTHVEALDALAESGDWDAVQLRVTDRQPIEVQAAALVKSVDEEYTAELSRSELNMKTVQGRILFLVPASAFSTFIIAAVFAWGSVRKIFELRFEERVTERTRIARDLHDTLLQSFHGLLLSFQTVYDLLPARPSEARQTLGIAIDEAAAAITEGRDAVQGLRSSTAETSDIAEAIKGIGEVLAATGTNPAPAIFLVAVEGTPQDLSPILRDEVYRIAAEALRNAFRHAQARQIEVDVGYDERQFRLRIRDDGKGIDAGVLGRDGRPGHFGLHGMRERAKLAGGELAVWSQLNSGTEIELTIPASTAYSAPRHRHWWSGRVSGSFSDRTETKIKR